ncbi:transglutaminase domain-containing protein [Ruminococcus sp.]|uniref:transglutaminase domain-containing protein n=1 Tax=Ruminococcus sp. TaxID=41978 RepID=UPI003AB3D019
MKKAITILAICSLLLTACGQIDDTESKSETTTAIASESTAGEDTAETSSAKEEKDTSEATTTTKKSSQTVSSSSKPTGTTVTTTQKFSSLNANGNSNQRQNNAVQNNNGQVNYQPEQNNQQPDNNQSNNGAQQNNQSSDNKPQNNNPSPPVTTAKPAVTNPPTTTPKPQTEPPEDIIEDTTSLQSVLNYVNSLGRTTDEYYNIGAGLGHNGSDYGKAEAVYNWIRGNVSGNCQVFSAATMYACKGVGLECRYAFFSPDAWYGHMANLVCVEGTWYVFDTQGGRFLKSDKYGEITRIFDENDNTIEISISESAY